MSVTTLKGGQELELRVAAPEDAEQVLTYIEQVSGESSFLTFGPGEFALSVEQEADFFRACQKSPNRLYILALIDGELVGTANLMASPRPRLRHRVELGMSVLRRFWGLGIGSALLEHLLEWARQNPMLTKLDLLVRTDNSKAIALYRSRAFVEEGVLRKQICIEGTHYDVIAMGIEV